MPGNITLAVSQANITVDQQNTTVAVTSTPSTVVVGESRTTSNADIRNAISNAFPITYSTSTGVIGIDPSAISGGNVVFGGNATGDITVDKSTGAFFEYNVTGNVTGITLSNFNAGETATIIFTQDAIGGHQIDTTTTPSNWSAWNFASGSSSIDENPTNWSTLSIFGLGPTGGAANAYYASVVREETADTLTNLIVTGNVSAGGTITATSGFLGELTGNVTGTVSSLANHTTAGLTENTNLYYTDARARSSINTLTNSASGGGALAYNSGSGTIIYTPPDLTAFGLTNAQAQAYIQSNGLTMTSAISSDSNITTTANTSAAHGTFTGAQSITATGNVSIGGRLTVTGNIDSETVKDLLIEDREITLGYGTTGAPSSNSQIIIDRGSSANTYLKWDEGTDKWKFSNDGSTEFSLPESTTDVAEGTNQYYTDARSRGAVSVTTASSSGEGALSYNNTTGVFTFTPADLSAGISNAQAQAFIQSSGLAMTANITSNSLISTTGNVQINPDTTSAIGMKGLTYRSDFNLLGLGTTTPQTGLDIVCDQNVYAQIYLREYADTFFGPDLSTYKARGSVASPTAAQVGDRLMELKPSGYSGSGFLNSMGQIMYVDSANPISSTSMPMGFSWEGYKDGDMSGSYGSLMKLRANGDFQIGSLGFNSANNAPNFAVTHSGTVSAVGNITTSGHISTTGFGTVEGFSGTFGNVGLSANTITIPNNGSINFSDNDGLISGVQTFNASTQLNCLSGNITASTNSGIGGFQNGIGLVQFNDTGNLAAGYSLAIGDTNPQGIFSIQQDSSNPTKYDHWKRFGGDGSGLDTKGINNHYYRANGTVASPGVIRSGGMVVEDNYHAYDGTQFYKGARSYVIHDSPAGAPATNAVNLSYEFTSIPSVNNEHSRLAICANGSIQFNANNTIQNSAYNANRNGGNASIALDGTISSVANITATGNVSGNYILGNGSLLTGISAGGVSNAQAQAYIEANGLDATANISTTERLESNRLYGGNTTVDLSLIFGSAGSGGGTSYLGFSSANDPDVPDGTKILIQDSSATNPFANGSIKSDNVFFTRKFSGGGGYYLLYTDEACQSLVSASTSDINPTTANVTYAMLQARDAITLGPDSAARSSNVYLQKARIRYDVDIGETSLRNSKVDISGDTTMTNYSGNAALTLVNNRNDSGVPTQVVMKQNKNAGGAAGVAGDQLSVLNTQGMTANVSAGLKTYANVLAKITDPTDGAEDGEIDFRLIKAGTETSTMLLKSTELDLNVPLTMDSNLQINADTDVSGLSGLTFDTTTNNLGLGTTTPKAALHIRGTSNESQIYMTEYNGTSSAGIDLRTFRAGGSEASPTVTPKSDRIWESLHYAYDGTGTSGDGISTGFQTAFAEQIITDPVVDHASQVVPVFKQYYTYLDGDTTASSPHALMRMRSNGDIQFSIADAFDYTDPANAVIKNDGSITTTSGVTATGNVTGNYILGNGSLLTGITAGGSTDSFGTFTVSGQTNVQASQANAQVEFAAGSGITLTTSGNTITIAGSGGSYGNTQVANFLNSDTMTANIAYTGNLLVGAPTSTNTLSLTGGDVIAGNTNIGTGSTADRLIITANSGAADPGFSDGTAIVGKNGTGDAAYWNGNTYYTKALGNNEYDLYTDSGLTTKSASTLGSLYNTGSNGIQFDYPGVGTSQANVIGTLEVTEGVNLSTNGSNADFGGNITTGSTKGIYVGTGGINAQGGGTITMSGLRVTDFSANDPLGIKIVANSALGGGSYASPFQGAIVYVTGDRHGSRGAPAYWDGTSNWRYFSDDATVTI